MNATRQKHLFAAATALSDCARHLRLATHTYVSSAPGRAHLDFVIAVVSSAQRAVEKLLRRTE